MVLVLVPPLALLSSPLWRDDVLLLLLLLFLPHFDLTQVSLLLIAAVDAAAMVQKLVHVLLLLLLP